MVEYNEAYLKLSDTQINKLKTAAKNQTGVTLRINKYKCLMKKVYLVNELLLTTRQTTKLKNAFENNIISTDINFSRAQISKIIQS